MIIQNSFNRNINYKMTNNCDKLGLVEYLVTTKTGILT